MMAFCEKIESHLIFPLLRKLFCQLLKMCIIGPTTKYSSHWKLRKRYRVKRSENNTNVTIFCRCSETSKALPTPLVGGQQ